MLPVPAVSFGCVGNRVYTGAGDTDAYFAIPGAKFATVEESLSDHRARE